MERLWQPELKGEDWLVVLPETPMARRIVRTRPDGSPLRFWSEKSAQLHADSLNRKAAMIF